MILPILSLNCLSTSLLILCNQSTVLRLKDELPINTDNIFLVNENSELSGIVPINALITSKTDKRISDHILEEPIIFNTHDKDDAVAKLFADYNLVSAPVIKLIKKRLPRQVYAMKKTFSLLCKKVPKIAPCG